MHTLLMLHIPLRLSLPPSPSRIRVVSRERRGGRPHTPANHPKVSAAAAAPWIPGPAAPPPPASGRSPRFVPRALRLSPPRPRLCRRGHAGPRGKHAALSRDGLMMAARCLVTIAATCSCPAVVMVLRQMLGKMGHKRSASCKVQGVPREQGHRQEGTASLASPAGAQGRHPDAMVFIGGFYL